MWCCIRDNDAKRVGLLCRGGPRECGPRVKSCQGEADFGPICVVQCTVHKVVVHRRNSVTSQRPWDWLIGSTRLLHVELAPAGAEYKVKRSQSGKLLPRKEGQEEDVWIWGDLATTSDSASGATILNAGEDLPSFEIQPASDLVLRVREGEADWRRRDEPLDLLGETTFTIDEDVFPSAFACSEIAGTADKGDYCVRGAFSLPVVMRSRVAGVVWLSIALGCDDPEEELTLLRRRERFSHAAARGLSTACAEECACKERLSTDAPLPRKPTAVSKHWSPHARFNKRCGGDQMAEEMVEDEKPEEITDGSDARKLPRACHAQQQEEAQQQKTAAYRPLALPTLPHAAQLQAGGSLQETNPQTPPSPVLLIGHRKAITCCATSPCGEKLVTGSLDRTAIVWQAADGSQLQCFTEHGARIDACAVFPDSYRVLTLDSDTVGLIWSMHTGEQLLRLDGVARCFEIFPSGDFVLTALAGRKAEIQATAAVFSAQGGAVPLCGHESAVLACAVFPRGDQALTVSRDHTGIVWSTEGENLCVLSGHTKPVTCCALSPKGDWVVTGSEDRTARVWTHDNDGAIFRRCSRFTAHTQAVRSCSVVLYGDAVVTVGDRNEVFVWHLDASRCLKLAVTADSICAVAVFPSGREIIAATTGARESVVYSCMTGRQLASLRRRWKGRSSAPVPPQDIPPPPPPPLPDAKAADGEEADDTDAVPPEAVDAEDRVAPPSDQADYTEVAGVCAVLPDGDWAVTTWEDGAATIWPRTSLFGVSGAPGPGGPGFWFNSSPAEGMPFRERQCLAI